MPTEGRPPVDPESILQRVIAEHDVLRGMIERTEVLAKRVVQGRVRFAKDLRDQLKVLEGRFLQHIEMEEKVVAPALLAADAWGPARVERMHEEHARQREILTEMWSAGRHGEPNIFVLALASWGFVRMLREDMEEEERVSLNDRVLGEDPVDSSPDTD